MNYINVRLSQPKGSEWTARMRCEGCQNVYFGDFRHEPQKCQDCRDPYNPIYFGNVVRYQSLNKKQDY